MPDLKQYMTRRLNLGGGPEKVLWRNADELGGSRQGECVCKHAYANAQVSPRSHDPKEPLLISLPVMLSFIFQPNELYFGPTFGELP